MRVGVLTSGGDCPGLDAAIRATTRRLILNYDYEVLGVKNGYSGLIEGEIEPLSLYSVSGILPKGGTILGTSRIPVEKIEEQAERIGENMRRYEIDALIVIGDAEAITGAAALQESGINTVCIPATIDNDIVGTDMTFGFDTAVSIATEAIDRVHSTADSHHRIMVVELMGHDTGWIATMAGLAGGADFILIPEEPVSMDNVASMLKKRHANKKFSIVVVAEGAIRALQAAHVASGTYRYAADYVGAELEKRTGMETRVIILGHVQRGGTPTAFDRVLATRFGVEAADLIAGQQFGKMTAMHSGEVRQVALSEVAGKTRKVDKKFYEIASVFFG